MPTLATTRTTIPGFRADQPLDEAALAAAAFMARYSGRTLDAYRHDLLTFFQWAAEASRPDERAVLVIDHERVPACGLCCGNECRYGHSSLLVALVHGETLRPAGAHTGRCRCRAAGFP